MFFVTLKGCEKMCAATVKICVAAFDHIFLCLRKCAAVSENTLCFKERAATSQRY